MSVYKLRAECLPDVVQFIENTNKRGTMITNYKIEKDKLVSDVYFEFELKLTIPEIIDILQNQKDSHVMYQTVNPIDKYTGERDYDLLSTKFKVGDTVEVYCPLISETKHIEKVSEIDGDWLIFEGDSGKIQYWYCTKVD